MERNVLIAIIEPSSLVCQEQIEKYLEITTFF